MSCKAEELSLYLIDAFFREETRSKCDKLKPFAEDLDRLEFGVF